MNPQLEKLGLSFRHRLPLLLQNEAAECGLACLGMVAGYYGFETDLINLRARFVVSTRGTTLLDIIEMASKLNLDSRAIKADHSDIKFVKLPCILHWNFNHFVVLKKINFKLNGDIKSFLINDPARGEVQVSVQDFSNSFTGVVLELTPTSKFEQKIEKKKINFFSLIGNVVGLNRALFQVFLLGVTLEIFALASPFFMQLVVDGAVFTSDREMLITLVFSFGVLLFIENIISAFRSWVLLYISVQMNLQWTTNVFTHLLNLPIGYFEKRNLGDVVSRFDSVSRIERTLSTRLIEALLDAFFSVIIVVILLIYSPIMTAIVLSFLCSYFFLRFVAFEKFRSINEQQLLLESKASQIFIESVNGIQTLKLFNYEKKRSAFWINSVILSVNQKIKIQKMQLGFGVLEKVMKGFENVTVVGIGALFVINNQISLGMLLAFLSYKVILVGRMYSFVESIFELKIVSVQSERLADIVLTEREDAPKVDSNNFQVFESEPVFNNMPPQFVNSDIQIEFRNISFRYSDSAPWILRNFSLCIKRGESIAITGVSGSGKTTLLKLLTGFLEPNEGEIFVGGHLISKIGQHNLRKIIGVVMQNDQLFSGSIAENISFFDVESKQPEIVECAQLASFESDIDLMPMGYQTFVSGMGTSLSGGQKQRLLIARALYKKPQILILDEATSHLDVENESRVSDAISKILLTRLIVAHRIETIRSADRVVKIGNGHVVSDIRQR